MKRLFLCLPLILAACATPDDYEYVAKEFTAQGEEELAKKARAKAAQLRSAKP